jgi:hypothetical protein
MFSFFNKSAATPSEKALQKLGISYERQGDEFLVRGDINLSGKRLFLLPDLSKVVVLGNFDCSDNRLLSLEKSPRSVSGSFNCDRNRLWSLKGAPKSIGEDFSCRYNEITTLEDGPEVVGRYFDCSKNLIETMMFAPRAAGGTKSDYGDFTVPVAPAPQQQPAAPASTATEPSSAPQAAGDSQIAVATTLQAPLSVGRPLALKR